MTQGKRLGVGATFAKAVWNVARQDRGGASGNGPVLIADMQVVATSRKNLALTGMNVTGGPQPGGVTCSSTVYGLPVSAAVAIKRIVAPSIEKICPAPASVKTG